MVCVAQQQIAQKRLILGVECQSPGRRLVSQSVLITLCVNLGRIV